MTDRRSKYFRLDTDEQKAFAKDYKKRLEWFYDFVLLREHKYCKGVYWYELIQKGELAV